MMRLNEFLLLTFALISLFLCCYEYIATCVLGVGILQHPVSESSDAGCHTWSKGEVSAHC